MNVLPRDRQIAAIAALSEGTSIRTTERLTGIHSDTIMRFGARVGHGCAALLMDRTVRDLPSQIIQAAFIWRRCTLMKVSMERKELPPVTTARMANSRA